MTTILLILILIAQIFGLLMLLALLCAMGEKEKDDLQ